MGSKEEEICFENNEEILENGKQTDTKEKNNANFGALDNEELFVQFKSPDTLTSRAREDTTLMGFQKEELAQQNIIEEKKKAQRKTIKIGSIESSQIWKEGHKTECVDQRSSENSKIILCDSTVPSLKLLSWNIRGFGPDLKVTELRILIRLHRVEVAFIQESKKETIFRKELRTWYDDE
ncbi:hypothetical protein GQ457_09G013600 [Hibiscus cannabinus]